MADTTIRRTNAATYGGRAVRAMLIQNGEGADHFQGVPEALRALGMQADRFGPERAPVASMRGVDVLVLADVLAPRSLHALRLARRNGTATVLLMDGITDYRNTFLNPSVGPSFLRPAPVDAIACAGAVDQLVLTALGNRAVVTGLPRFVGQHVGAGEPEAGTVLIATARRPVFHEDERPLLLEALHRVRTAAGRVGARILWRLTDDLDRDLGVRNEPGALRECLDRAAAVLTTPSTLALEAMARGRPTMLLLPVMCPLWLSAPMVLVSDPSSHLAIPDAVPAITCAARALGEGAMGAPIRWYPGDHESALRDLLSASESSRVALRGATAAMLEPSDSAAQRVAVLAHRLAITRERGAGSLVEVPEVARHPARVMIAQSPYLPRYPRNEDNRGGRHGRDARATSFGSQSARHAKPRVVSCVLCDDSCVGGVTTWSLRMGRAFRDLDLPFEFRTLIVAAAPRTPWDPGFPVPDDGLTDLCVLDPTADHVRIVETLRGAIESLSPAIVIPNYADVCYAAAMQMLPAGVRTLAIAHTHDAGYQRTLSLYSRWSACVGVSDACMNWLAPLAAGRPCEKIVYGVPIAHGLNAHADRAGLELAYIGRMDETQKRVSDLLVLLRELDRLRVPHRFHVVGDGPELPRWRERVGALSLPDNRVVIHGRRSPEWVERFLPTIDVSVLVSNYEGASVSMLESMGQGVVPCVTRVASGVSEWVIDGETGVTVPIGDMADMAQRIAELARDRARLRDMGQAAQARVARGAGIEATARAYSALFERCLRSPIPDGPRDLGLRLDDQWRWSPVTPEMPALSDELALRRMREAGFQCIAFNHPEPGCDAVLLSASSAHASKHEIDAWRSQGLGVVVSPHLLDESPVRLAERLLRDAVTRGCVRLAVYGAGRHTRRIAELFELNLPIVAILDDNPRADARMFGLPVLRPAAAFERFEIDCVLLSSDAHEPALWRASRPWRDRGVRVLPMYGQHEDALSATPVAVSQSA